MSSRRIPLSEARSSSRGPLAVWRHARERLLPIARPAPRPSFVVPSPATIVTIGSCFARNIERHLAMLDYDVPTLRFTAPPNEAYVPAPNALLNKYTPASIFQEVEWCEKIFARDGLVTEPDCASFAFKCANGDVIDTNLPTVVPVSTERFVERRRQVYEVFAQCFTAECVTLTLGLIEAWFDAQNQNYIAIAPAAMHFRRQAARFEFEVLSFEQCRRFVQGTIDSVRLHNPKCVFLLTTSPVPLESTFTGTDVITANMHSKSVLRAAAGEISSANAGVDYFPAYESVMLTRSSEPWMADDRHVTDAFVGGIVGQLVPSYFPGAATGARYYQRAATAFEAGDLDLAEQQVQAALRETPDSGPYRLLAGQIALRKRTPDLAEEHLRVALKDAGCAPRAFERLSRALSQRGQTAAALKASAEAVRLKPASIEFRLQRAELLESSGEYALAVEEIQKIIEVKPSHRLYARLARAFVRQGRREEAAQMFEKAMRCSPGPWLAAGYASVAAREFLTSGWYVEAEQFALRGLEQRNTRALNLQLSAARDGLRRTAMMP